MERWGAQEEEETREEPNHHTAYSEAAKYFTGYIFSFAFWFFFFFWENGEEEKTSPPSPSASACKSRRAQRIEVEIGLNLDETTGKEEGKECSNRTQTVHKHKVISYQPTLKYLPAGWEGGREKVKEEEKKKNR